MKQLALLLSMFALGSAARAEAQEKVDYTKQIVPLLKKYCYKCHSKDTKKKPKAGLRLDDPKLIMKGSEDGKVLVPGDPKKSSIYTRTSLPPDHDDIMPPKGDTLKKAELKILETWIKEGASFGKESGDSDPLNRNVAPVDAKAMEALRKAGALAMPLAANTNLISVSFIGGSDKVNDSHLAQLKAVADQLVWLNLAGTKVTNGGLKNLEALKNLTKLHLEKTQIGDAGLASLKGLADLEYLNLYGTQVTDAGLQQLAGLKNLKNLYVWQTKVTKGGAANLKKALPKVDINTGEELTKVAPPPPPKPTAKAINAKCPVTNKPVASATLTYKGQVIGFCCDNCPAKFKAEPIKYIGKVKEFKAPVAKKPINAKCPITGKNINPKATYEYKGQLIAFCCEKCLAKFKAEPIKFIGKVKEFRDPARAAIDGEGFIKHFLVLAPIPTETEDNGAEEINKQQIKNEAAIKPKKGQKVKIGGKEFTWKSVLAPEYFVDFREIFGETRGEDAIAYAVAYVDSPTEVKDVEVRIGTNDQGRLYLNGKQVINNEETRALDKDQDTAKVTLKKGKNVVVLKVINEKNNWQGCIRFVKGGKPLTNLKVSLNP